MVRVQSRKGLEKGSSERVSSVVEFRGAAGDKSKDPELLCLSTCFVVGDVSKRVPRTASVYNDESCVLVSHGL